MEESKIYRSVIIKPRVPPTIYRGFENTFNVQVLVERTLCLSVIKPTIIISTRSKKKVLLRRTNAELYIRIFCVKTGEGVFAQVRRGRMSPIPSPGSPVTDKRVSVNGRGGLYEVRRSRLWPPVRPSGRLFLSRGGFEGGVEPNSTSTPPGTT